MPARANAVLAGPWLTDSPTLPILVSVARFDPASCSRNKRSARLSFTELLIWSGWLAPPQPPPRPKRGALLNELHPDCLVGPPPLEGGPLWLKPDALPFAPRAVLCWWCRREVTLLAPLPHQGSAPLAELRRRWSCAPDLRRPVRITSAASRCLELRSRCLGCPTGFDPVPTGSQSVMQSHYTTGTTGTTGAHRRVRHAR